jgi:hypothetical protein
MLTVFEVLAQAVSAAKKPPSQWDMETIIGCWKVRARYQQHATELRLASWTPVPWACSYSWKLF